jgi:hypothetical protein
VSEAVAHVPVPKEALCLGCNYPLRGLPENRCPECGLDFDPADDWTMNLGRPMTPFARDLIRSETRWAWPAFFVAAAMILWGSAWLPGGQVVEFIGACLLLVNVVYRGVRFSAIVLLARHYRQKRRIRLGFLASPYASFVLLVFLITCVALDVPLRISLMFARPAIYRIWAVHPYTGGTIPGRWLGPLRADSIGVSPTYVTIQDAWSGTIVLNPETHEFTTYPPNLPWVRLWHWWFPRPRE